MDKRKFDTIVLGVPHNEFSSLDLNMITKEENVVYDVKGVLACEFVDGKL